MTSTLADSLATTAQPAGTDDLTDAEAGSAIMVATQWIKHGLPEKGWITNLYPLIPMFLALGWAWADERGKNPIVNWGTVAARAFKIFIFSVGVYSVGKQLVKKEPKDARGP